MANKDDKLAVKPEQTDSERFTAMCIRELTGLNPVSGRDFENDPFKRRMINNYFMVIDIQLRELEDVRLAKIAKNPKDKWNELLSYTWNNVDLQNLTKNISNYALIGLDPLSPNHISMYPVKTKDKTKWSYLFIKGYNGLELIARKYGKDIPDDITVEVVYSTDVFKIIKKDVNNKVENYKFEVVNPFSRGDIVGGFYYIQFLQLPEKNKIKVFSMNDIEKRKPKNASINFWGGERKVQKWDKEAGGYVDTDQVEKVEGWLDEMVYKTIKAAGWKNITIDSSKIDSVLQSVLDHDKLHDVEDIQVENKEQTAAGNTINISDIQPKTEEKPKSELF